MALTATATPMPQCTAEVSAARPDLRRYERLIATIRKASNPSRRVMTSAWSMTAADLQISNNETESQDESPVYRGISDRSSRLWMASATDDEP